MRACMRVRRDRAVCAKEPMGPWIAHAARVGRPHTGRRCQKWMGIGNSGRSNQSHEGIQGEQTKSLLQAGGAISSSSLSFQKEGTDRALQSTVPAAQRAPLCFLDPRARIALLSCMKTAPEAYHLCAERGASLCKAPSWILLLQSSVSLPTLESAPHTRLPCISLSLPIETMRAFGQLWAPRSHISALIPAFSFLVISVGWLLYRHGWPSVSHRRRRCKPTRNR